MKATQPNLSLCEHLLRAGKSILDLQLGIVSYVYNDDYKLIAINDVSNEYKAGDIVKLDKTYCREVVESGNSIALTEINGIKGLREHPLYVENTIEAYIGSPIYLNSEIWGTVNFSSVNVRSNVFSKAEISLVDSFAKLISDSIPN